MLLSQAYHLLHYQFIGHYVYELDAGFEPNTIQESDDLLYMWMGGNEL